MQVVPEQERLIREAFRKLNAQTVIRDREFTEAEKLTPAEQAAWDAWVRKK